MELKREDVAPETMQGLQKLQQEMLRRFFTPPSVTRLLKLATGIVQSKREPSAAMLKSLFHAISPALAGLLKINPEKYQKQKSATWPSEAELVWNLLLAAGKAFEMEEEEAAADTEDEAPEPSPAEEEAEDPEIPPTRRSYSCSTRGRPHCRLCF